jgi:hypothetical protein
MLNEPSSAIALLRLLIPDTRIHSLNEILLDVVLDLNQRLDSHDCSSMFAIFWL